ncbi:MAG: hypothetical protein ACR2N1_01630 [Rubripirellula sp.]
MRMTDASEKHGLAEADTLGRCHTITAPLVAKHFNSTARRKSLGDENTPQTRGTQACQVPGMQGVI